MSDDPVRPTPPTRRDLMRRALANPSLRRVLVAYLVFNVAEFANWIALLVWAYDRNGVRGASVLALLQLVPATVLAPVTAAFSARLSRRQALTVGYGAQALAYLATGVALAADAPYAVVAVLAALAAVALTFTRPVHNSVLPELADTTGELTAANTASGSVEAVAAFAGPLLTAVVIVPWGEAGVLLLTGSALTVAAVLTSRLRVAGAGEGRLVAGQGERPLLLEVVRNRTARTLSAMVAAEYVLVGMMDILLVVLALDLLDLSAAGPGVLTAAMGAGSVVGAAGTVVLVGRDRLALVLVVAALATGAAIAVAGQVPGAVLAALLLAAAGAGKLFVDVGSRTLAQRALPERLLVAVFGVQEAVMMAGLAIGSLVAPILVATGGPRWAFVAAGAFLPLVALLSWWGLRDADAQAVVPGEVFEVLSRVPILAVLAPRTVERLARGAATTDLPVGTVVVREGDLGETFYVLVSGRARVTHRGAVLRDLGPGDWFGEIALLRAVPRTATVTLTTDAALVCVEREPFLVAVTGTPRAVAAADEHADRYIDTGD